MKLPYFTPTVTVCGGNTSSKQNELLLLNSQAGLQSATPGHRVNVVYHHSINELPLQATCSQQSLPHGLSQFHLCLSLSPFRSPSPLSISWLFFVQYLLEKTMDNNPWNSTGEPPMGAIKLSCPGGVQVHSSNCNYRPEKPMFRFNCSDE